MLLFIIIHFVPLFVGINAFYLPGLAPVTYCTGDKHSDNCVYDVPVFVNRLNSLESLIPYEYGRFDFCESAKEEKDPSMNLGEVVFGDRIKHSPYKLKFMEAVSCKTVCEKKYTPHNDTSMEKLNFMRKAIKLNYAQNWVIDNMPATWCYTTADGSQYCSRTFPVGCYVTKELRKMDTCVIDLRFNEADTHYFFNHVDLTIKYQPGESDTGRIVAAMVEPKSVAYDASAKGDQMCRKDNVMGIRGGKLVQETAVRYTYSVKWVAVGNVKWASRWDYILEDRLGGIQLMSICNSLVIVTFLGAIFAKLMWKNLRQSEEEVSKNTTSKCCFCIKKKQITNEFNWKLIYGDIFRPPSCGMLLSVFIGSGIQIILTSVLTLVFAAAGILSPPNRGALGTAMLVFFACLGFPAGYKSARLYKAFGGQKKLMNAVLTAVACPGIVFSIALLLNVVFLSEGSSAAIPITTILALLGLWLGISLPLTLLGSFFGFRKMSYEHPVKTHPTPRNVPKLRLCLKPVSGMVIGGILPASCIFIQVFFILNSLFAHQVYYRFGYLAIVFLLMVLICFLVTILICYFHLCAEDYRWWWRSFLNSGFTAFYFFIYCIYYYVQKTELQGVDTAFIYFGYTFIAAFLLFLLTGTIGFFSCFWFVTKIYRNVNTDDTWSLEGPDVKSQEL